MIWLKKWAEQRPEALFLNDFSFAQTLELTKTAAQNLLTLLPASPRVALLSENSPEMVFSLFALLALNKEVLLLNTALTVSELSEQLSELDISCLISSDSQASKLSNLTEKFSIISLDNLSKNLVKFDRKTLNVSVKFDRKSAEQIAVIMNTSATTGKFKSVPITWGMIEAQVQASAEVIGVQPDDNWLAVLPIFHVSGLSIVMRSLYNGSRVTILPKFDEEQILQLVNSGQLNMMSLVPTMLQRLIDRLSKNRLRMILLGGEFIPQPLITAAFAKKLPIYKTYGMTETFSQSVTFNILEAPDKIDSVGRPLPGVKLKIRQPDSSGAGEIWLTSPMLMPHYLGAKALSDGFATGDIGYLDADGYLYVLNRRKDIIISGGENIYPKELENLLYARPDVTECALVPRPSQQWGQVPALFYAGSATPAELSSYLSSQLAKYKLPRTITKLDSLPKNATGKILRKELK